MRLYQVDAFTNESFKGNPAAVCLMDTPQADTWMQAFASEMNLSETAFLQPNDDYYRLRWFTPSIEVDLCGHATLASAHVLWEIGAAKRGVPIQFDTRSGLLTASYADYWIQLNFPATPAKETTCNIDLERALGVKPTFVGRSTFDFLAELPSETLVRELSPDFALIERAASRGVIVTAKSKSEDYDFVSVSYTHLTLPTILLV